MLKRILVGLGGTDYTVAAINQAVALAMANDAEVTGVTIIDKERSVLCRPAATWRRAAMLTNSSTTG